MHPDTVLDTTTHHECQSVDDNMTTAEDSASPSKQVAFSSEYFSENESLSEHEIVWVRSAASGSHTAGPQQVMPAPTTFLDTEPDQIRDVFSSVLGDVFHFMDRVRVPMHHELKKSYFFRPKPNETHC